MPCDFVLGSFTPKIGRLAIKEVREEAFHLTHASATINASRASWAT
jgi:hypothetical protein